MKRKDFINTMKQNKNKKKTRVKRRIDKERKKKYSTFDINNEIIKKMDNHNLKTWNEIL